MGSSDRAVVSRVVESHTHGGGVQAEKTSGTGWFDVSSSDPEVADAWLQDTYAPYRRQRHGDASGFRFTATGGRGPGFSIATVHHGMAFEVETEPLVDAVVVNTTLGGRVEIGCEHGPVTPEPGTPHLLPPGGSWRIRWEDLTTETLRLERSVLQRAAVDIGWNGGAVRFAGVTPRSPGWARFLRSTIAHVRDDVLALGPPDVAGPALREAARELAVAVLVTFPSNVVATLEDGASSPGPVEQAEPPGHTGSAEPAVIRRAVEFIHAHAHRDIGVADIADAARLGVRGLQVAFRRHLDQTPLEYLRRVRMDNAHRDLQGADPAEGATVAEIAARWGFSHPGRFAVEYRREFGRHPSETLRA